MEAHEALQNVPLFSSLNTKHLRGLGKSCTERSYKAGEFLVRQNNPGVGVFIITAGKVKVAKTNEAGNRFDIAEHGAGEVIGEMAVLDGAVRSADVVCLEDTTCLVLASWAFNSFLEAHPEVALEILPVVVRRFRETHGALMRLQGQAQ